MKKIHLLLTFMMVYATVNYAQSYAEEIVNYRASLNDQYMSSDHSPLKEEDRSWFDGHGFFPIDDAFRFEAKYIPIEDGEIFEMKTSTDRLPLYKPYAIAQFSYQGQIHELTLYQNVEYSKKPGYRDYLFLPFKDRTNGHSSYGAGRFIELKMSTTDSIVIDFNRSFNPLCAYNDKYSCPIPPKENHLNFAVQAGIRKPIGFH